VVVTLLITAVVFGLLVAQLVWANTFRRLQLGEPPGPNSGVNNLEFSLAYLDDRATKLEAITNWIERDSHCIGLSAMGREFDAGLGTNARVFVAGMLGPTNAGKAGYYYFLKNYLFPRDVEVSLDGKSPSDSHGIHGVPCDSPDVLRSNGFDVMIEFNDNRPKVIPLTPKAFRPANE
jgi:hypothetical protein